MCDPCNEIPIPVRSQDEVRSEGVSHALRLMVPVPRIP